MSEPKARFAAIRRLDTQPRLVKLARLVRERLPGDTDYGDPLSLAGDEPREVLARRLAAVTAERPSALREVGFSALQVWQSFSEAQGRGRGDEELAILFTDLAGFSDWALEAGDDAAVELLRQVGRAVEPPIEAAGGRVVKRLGDGVMAVFRDPRKALDAALAAQKAMNDISVAGFQPKMRAGIHLGRPRKLGGDYLGVDVNVAARVADAAKPCEVLVSDVVRERLLEEEGAAAGLKRRWLFSAPGTPRGMQVYVAQADG
jgi:adenylate cyclase